ncbi:peptide-methionine (S)-S-oxide reductase MsrA [Candidatus Saccharibacteria bacterium]|jgi:methionine-S-sulfoxide reductase|nr:peptide-methionine (S)-S-oxide reductase MsrA [Candidatus Saccharibacteria bacterium]MBP7834605.1 peptide-methionine (S)-S-oxide reductase MsrA [Candidatus Saccharibacteria bacterium]
MEESIVIGGGCFWCIEALFTNVNGVAEVISGYAGGDSENPSYDQVSAGVTGHAEVIKVSFNNDIIGLETILEVFLAVHDPTTPNRQGTDEGTQYRSIILYNNTNQKIIALKAIETMQNFWQDKIVTEVEKLGTFYPAEDYHQNYFKNNPENAYCQVVINPKLAKFKKDFAKLLR